MNQNLQLSAATSAPATRLGRLLHCGLILAGLVGALLLAHHGMLLTGFARMQQHPNDTLFNNYLFEHSYQFLRCDPRHQSLWDLPMFYPAPDILFYSDLMISFAPPYWVLRCAGFPPDLSFQLWMVLATAGNYVLALLFLRSCFRVGIPAAVFGATFFAAANARVFQMGHQQLLSQVFVLGAVWAAYKLFEQPADLPPRAAARRARWCIVTGSLCVALQFWGGFYFGFFLVLAGAVALCWALLLAELRRPLLATVRRHYLTFGLAAVGAGLLLAPVALHYLGTYQSSHRTRADILPLLPHIYSWICLGPDNIVHRWMWTHWPRLQAMPMGWEHILGLGVFTTPLVVAAAWHGRRHPRYYLLSLVAVCLIILPTVWHGGGSLWWLIYKVVPGAGAIRAVARIGLMLLLPAAVALAYILDHLHRRGLLWLALLLGLACVGEQLQDDRSFDRQTLRDRIAAIADVIPADASIFYYTTPADRAPLGETSVNVHVEAIWAAEQLGKYTINGQSGNYPPNYNLERVDGINGPVVEAAVRRLLQQWLRRYDVNAKSVAWINGTRRMELEEP